APGEGSVFTLYLPRTYVPSRAVTAQASQKSPQRLKEIEAAWTPAETFDDQALALLSNESAAIVDDRNEIQDGDRAVLIVEDDITAFVERGPRKLLVVEDDDVQRMSVVELIGNGDVNTTAVATGQEALSMLKGEHFDCMVLDLKLPDMTGFDLIEKLQRDVGRSDLPIIVYTGKELTRKEELHLK